MIVNFNKWNKAFEKSVLDCYEPNIGLFLGGADSTAIALCLADHKLPFLSVTCLNNPKTEDLNTLQTVIDYTKEYNTHFEVSNYKELTPFMKPFFTYKWNFSPVLSCIDALDTKVFLHGSKFGTFVREYKLVEKNISALEDYVEKNINVLEDYGKLGKGTHAESLFNQCIISMLMNVWIKYPYVNEEILKAFDKNHRITREIEKLPVTKYLIDRNIPIPKIAGTFTEQWQ